MLFTTFPTATPVQHRGEDSRVSTIFQKSSAPSQTSLKRSIDDYAKDGGEELFTKMHCVLIANPNDSIGIRLENAVHLGKEFLAAIFSVIVYRDS